MPWIDLRVRKPTVKDHDEGGRVLWRCQSGYTFCGCHNNVRTDLIAWMPIPKFTPLPDPPEGYEFLADHDATPHPEAMWLDGHEWRHRTMKPYQQDAVYAVPIEPPEPQYRPFANAEEFRPFRERWWRQKGCRTHNPPSYYTESGVAFRTWQKAFNEMEFEDGTPFGIKVQD